MFLYCIEEEVKRKGAIITLAPKTSEATTWPDAVLFDLGNTLIRKSSLINAALEIEHVCFPAGLDPSHATQLGNAVQAEIDDLYRNGRRDQPGWLDIWQSVLSRLSVRSAPQQTARLARAHLQKLVKDWLPIPGAESVLNALHRASVPMAIVSNVTGPPEIFHESLERSGWRPYFECVVWSSEIGRRKPDPAPFLKALQETGVSPSRRVVMIGDNEAADIQGGLNLGLTTIRVHAPAGAFSQAHHVKTLPELCQFFASGDWAQ